MVLSKRAFSSASAPWRSRRTPAGWPGGAHRTRQSQTALPFDDTDDSDEPLLPSAPAFDRADEERAVLESMSGGRGARRTERAEVARARPDPAARS